MKARRLVALLCLFLCVSTQAQAYTVQYKTAAMYNGSAVSYYNVTSNVLWLGDSRIVQMYNYKHRQSFVAVWGGAYMTNWGGQRLRIDSTERTADIKSILNSMTQARGKAYCVLVPTINDYSKGNHYKEALARYMKLYRKIKKMNPNVVILSPSLVKIKNGYSCKRFNKALKKKVEHYIPLKIKKKWYADKVHYTKTGLRYIYKKVNKYVE